MPWVFTESGIYMLMTVLKSDLAIQQSKALIRTFRAMKDYIVENQSLISQHDYLRLAMTVSETAWDVSEIKTKLVDHEEKLNNVIIQLQDKAPIAIKEDADIDNNLCAEVLVLQTALAVSLNTDFFNRVFGRDTRKNVSGHIETFEDGKGGTYEHLYPSREYVPVDQETAERMLGDKVMNEPAAVQMGDHTLTVLSAVRDESAMILDMTLECPAGVRGLKYDFLTNEGKGAWFAEDAGYFFGVDRASEMMYVDMDSSMESSLRILYYCVFLEKTADREAPVLTAGAAQEGSDPENQTFDLQEIILPVEKTVAAVRFTAVDGGTAELSPFSLRVCPPAESGEAGYVIAAVEPAETIRLQMKNGETFTVRDASSDNTMYLCGGLGNSAAETAMVLNRLIDPGEVQSIRAGGTEYLPDP